MGLLLYLEPYFHFYANLGFLTCYFLQKEIALYTASKANLEFSQFNIDDDVDPLFKVKINLLNPLHNICGASVKLLYGQ